ncbi:hypothetical protein [Pseudoalteromonas sp.]|uniref:hypothetical protein n=1 Tax=Pseudoalteromonas sp. TaxID=53249 RepID=UPI00272D407D|nr:hypothetical protein [Pseudoalteromonas sp.]
MSKRLPRWSRHRYSLVRHEHNVPAQYLGRVLIDGERPGTITGNQGSNYLYVRLEDRIDKAEVRVNVNRLTFLDEYVKQSEPETRAKKKRKQAEEKAKPTDIETMWF